MDLTIRPYALSDEDAVVSLWTLCGLVVPWNDPRKDIERKLAEQPDLFLVGLQGSDLVATVMAGYEGHRGWINYLAIHPDHRRRGLGWRMMDEADSALRRMGCPKINLQVRETNAGVLEFYRRIGFSRDAVVSLGKRLVSDEHESPLGDGATDDQPSTGHV